MRFQLNLLVFFFLTVYVSVFCISFDLPPVSHSFVWSVMALSGLSVFFNCASSDCFSSKAEDRLFRKLFRRYNQFIRPVENVSDPVTVEFEVSISQLVKVVSFAFTYTQTYIHICTFGTNSAVCLVLKCLKALIIVQYLLNSYESL